MKLNNNSSYKAGGMARFRKACRLLHRDLSFFFAGMVLIYALSGIFMNHRNSINPNVTISRENMVIDKKLLKSKENMTSDDVKAMLAPLDETKNFTQFYFPEASTMKVFLKGGSSLVVDINSGEAVYEKVRERFTIADMVKLHFNPGRWWTWFADAFAVCLIIITLTGLFMLKGRTGLMGRGGIELVIGILIPIIFLLM